MADKGRGQFPKLAALMDASEADVPGCAASPREHRRQAWSTNPPGRVPRQVKRRTDVVAAGRPQA